MGILDSILGMFGKGKKGGGMGELIQALIEQFGGIDGIIEKLQGGGLGDQLSSWVGGGENASVTPSRITEALGNDNIQGVADKLGIDKGEAASKISAALPRVLDRLTPDGAMPEGGISMDTVSDLLARFNRR